ncbi:MAG: cytochrome c [Candidatus Marinimicrobia bacterium]|nr:cytochrome c [Candidatus Neomarinimicrobiota bacterium]MBT3692401.1 cytochrome c [Candidatus Neomarinimicrobiota bacterium]MBT3732390.1 cytochrome c [Candidatus Neomarinimicrobiota bacterium]MBT4144869.1 cytochrome c [Candidatus Neomarinimicrobiota bacterium]MBT4176940.1 cytochrome c [Candidatus Neomarinimicrobiota bacterium]
MLKPLIYFISLTVMSAVLMGAMPILMDDYNDHPKTMPQYRDKCTICHVYADGSGPLTHFGEKYDRAGLDFTETLMNEFPNLFNVDGSKIVAIKISSRSEESSVPGNEPFNLKKYYRAECKNCHGKYGDGDPFQGVPAWANQKWIKNRASKYDELLDIILYGKDKMIGHDGKITHDEAKQLLDLVIKIAKKYS